MKRILILVLFLIFNVHLGNAQKMDSIAHPEPIVITAQPVKKSQGEILKIAVIKIMGSHMDFDILKEVPKNYAYIMSVSVVIDSTGRIDTVYFPEKISAGLKKIIKPGTDLINKLKSIPVKFPDFKGKIAVFPIIYWRANDTSFDYLQDLLKNFQDLWPNFSPRDQKRQIILLPPYLNYFSYIECARG